MEKLNRTKSVLQETIDELKVAVPKDQPKSMAQMKEEMNKMVEDIFGFCDTDMDQTLPVLFPELLDLWIKVFVSDPILFLDWLLRFPSRFKKVFR